MLTAHTHIGLELLQHTRQRVSLMDIDGRPASMLLNKAGVFKVLLVAPQQTRSKLVARRCNISWKKP